MSISYVIKFATGNDISTVATSLVGSLGFLIDPTHCGRTPLVPTVTLVANDFEIDVSKVNLLARQIILEELGLEIDTSVRFYTHSDFSTQAEGGRLIACAASCLMKNYSGDLVLLFNEEMPLLLRSKHGTVINSAAEFWNRITRSAIEQPFKEEVLPVI
jgi:hypothetical protein